MRAFFASSRGRDILLYLVFVAMSFVFWLLLTLDKPRQETFRVHFAITGVPGNTTIIGDVPEELVVTVRSSGYVLARYWLGEDLEVNADFKSYSNGKGTLVFTHQDLADLLVSFFGTNSNILSFSPDQFSVKYTNLPGKKVPVVVEGSYRADMGYVVTGSAISMPDSVLVYSDSRTLSSLQRVSTSHIIAKGMRDSVYVSVGLKHLRDVKIVPDSVDVVIPVEPLVAKKSYLPVTVTNIPTGMNVVVFPSKVAVSYLVPISQYEKAASEPFEVIADCQQLGNAEKLPLTFGRIPHNFRNPRFVGIDSVEYIIEH